MIKIISRYLNIIVQNLPIFFDKKKEHESSVDNRAPTF